MSKNAQRNERRKAAKKEQARADEAASAVASGPKATGSFEELIGLGKALFLGSCVAAYAPKLQDLLKENGKAAEPEKSNEESEKDSPETEPTASPEGSEAIFTSLGARLVWHNCLGLAEPQTGEEAMQQWKALSQLEMDFGPKKAKRGNPSSDRILANLCGNLPQYLHILLALAMLHAFLFRSYFACLPWLLAWQTASLLIPLETLEQVPQVPLSQCPVKFRVLATLGIHALFLFFFGLELVWRMNFLVKILVLGLIIFHAHSVKPAAA
ncbi:unnamed protein product [Symbiodinium pilosum]|uniref:Transmembrane protein n=1 Tax=Symbiodinium pilosum TaxID=2952 RepID=A0A812KKN9_SYMPI|nr:unnamed protein product [Symbiodinium pilosum]